MKKKRVFYEIALIMASWRQSILTYLHLVKILVFSFCNMARFPKQTWTNKSFLIKDLFQRIIRDPAIFITNIKYNLRVCITYKCNLACRYCYANGLRTDIAEDMKLEDFSDLVVWAKDRGWRSIGFLGGEPTIHPRFPEMLELCYRNRMFVTIFTNNLFSTEIIPKLDKFWLQNIHINYTFGILNTKQKALFKENLKQLKTHGMYFHLSCIINHQDIDWREMFEDAKEYRPVYIKASLTLPGFSKQTSASEIFNNIKSLAEKILKMQEICIGMGIPFFVYRPIPLCMFSKEEWRVLKITFPFAAFSRCPIGFRGDYGIMVTVNPDLSTFPCSSVFIKGPNIFTFKDKNQISQFYKNSLKSLLSKPLMEACRDCNAHKRFVASLEGRLRTKLNFDGRMCQGGCLNFKEENQALCYVE